jgi:hypothetical protein
MKAPDVAVSTIWNGRTVTGEKTGFEGLIPVGWVASIASPVAANLSILVERQSGPTKP